MFSFFRVSGFLNPKIKNKKITQEIEMIKNQLKN